MSGNSGAWGIAMWKDGYSGSEPQAQGISLDGGDAIVPYLPTDSLGWLTAPPQGLGVPPVRTGDVAFAQRDGVVQFADYYEPRILTFQVTICNDGCPGCDPGTATDTFLSLNGISPGRARLLDAPGIEIVGDFDARMLLAADDWTPSAAQQIASKSTTTGNQVSWRFTLLTSGMLRLGWSANGSTVLTADSTAAPVVANGAPLWVRATLDVDNGAAGRTIMFYTSTDGVTWTQLGTTVIQAGVTSIFDGTASIGIGSRDSGTLDRFAGKVYYAEFRRGINGTIVANPDFSAEGVGTTQFDDSVGNVWEIIPPALIGSAPGAALMSARQKAKRLTKEWSRNCNGATLVIFPDCYDPNATEEEKTYRGPYLVHGRPRLAEVNWLPSDVGCADITLRFDAADARLLLADVTPGTPWNATHSEQIDVNGNMLREAYTLEGLTMTVNGATVLDQYFTAGGPDDGAYFDRFVSAANTSSPMTMPLSGSGTAGIPVVVGQIYTVSAWHQMNPVGGVQARIDWTWYTAAGAVVSTGTGTAQGNVTDWTRWSQTMTAPATAAFMQPRLSWTGTALVSQSLDFANAWMNVGGVATAPDTMEVVGDLCAYPVFNLLGTLTAPITVSYGLHTFVYGANVTGSVTVDTRYGRASDFVDVTQNLSGDYTSSLEPGVHDLRVSTGNLADNGFVSVEWENAVVSG